MNENDLRITITNDNERAFIAHKIVNHPIAKMTTLDLLAMFLAVEKLDYSLSELMIMVNHLESDFLEFLNRDDCNE